MLCNFHQSAIAGGAAPYLANEIARLIPKEDWQARVLAHAVVNAALAAASKKDVTTAAAGAATGELAGIIAVDAYHKTVGELSEEEKQTVSALATLASGLAGGLVGDSSASVVAAAQAGKTTVENNALGMMGAAAEAAANTAAVVAGATGNGSKGSANDDDWNAGGSCEGTREQCAVRDPSRDGTRGPGHTGNTDPANPGPTDTGNHDGQPDTGPNNTGNGSQVNTGPNNTGNNSDAPGTGGSTTVTPIPDAPNKDDLAYLSNNKNAIDDIVAGKGTAQTGKQTIGVPATQSKNPLNPVQQYDAHGNEIVYRTMSEKQYQIFRETGVMPATTETSVSPVLGYSSKYDGVTVKIVVKPGTFSELEKIGIAANSAAAKELPNMSTQTGKWMDTNARFKVEGGQMTTQLGQGKGMEIFNNNIVHFEQVK
ncbi:VENN motif pre-toxin domain-containing protein [Kosakonia sp. Marseille-Q7440]